ncbi:hypothetical protein Tco_0635651 [Tanacetum coccineum]
MSHYRVKVNLQSNCKKSSLQEKIKHKEINLHNDTAQVTVVMPSAEDGPVLSSLGGHMVEKVNESGNNEGVEVDVVDAVEGYFTSYHSSYARAMIELRADVELKDTIVMAMLKLVGEGFHTCTIHVKYEWKPPRIAYCKVFGHVRDECPKNIGSGVAKNLKNLNQAPLGVSVGPKVRFKQVKQVYRPVSKNNNANTSGNKKKDAESKK